jgi:hypothetical protein
MHKNASDRASAKPSQTDFVLLATISILGLLPVALAASLAVALMLHVAPG